MNKTVKYIGIGILVLGAVRIATRTPNQGPGDPNYHPSTYNPYPAGRDTSKDVKTAPLTPKQAKARAQNLADAEAARVRNENYKRWCTQYADMCTHFEGQVALAQEYARSHPQ